MVGSSQALSSAGRDLLNGYVANMAGHDELMAADGTIRPHWSAVLDACASLDPGSRRSRMERLNTRVRETGIAYDLFADPSSTNQPWRVDYFPLVIAPEEWRFLERALLQRARLFERLLADLYGPQSLLADGSVPHELIFSDPSYLRPCQGLAPARGYIQFFAADLARAPDRDGGGQARGVPGQGPRRGHGHP